MKRHCFRYLSLLVLLFFSLSLAAQTNGWREVYTVKKKDTLYGIARQYGISIPELMDANPEMKQMGYELKKGDVINIPYAKQQTVSQQVTKAPASVDDIRHRAIRVGVMLPLHHVDGDGKRMIEYYRGLLLACENLKQEGISTDIHAWNVPIDADIRNTLLANGAKECDIIFGPLYTKQVKYLGDFCRSENIKMVIPFSITGNDVAQNRQIFQVYQTAEQQNESAIHAFLERFPTQHVVLIDCNDTTSRKGIFTFGLRKKLEQQGRQYNITNLKSSEQSFVKAFSQTEPNVVILNTGRSPELNVALAKLNTLTAINPHIVVSLYGYTEWLMYTKVYLDFFHRYDTYIPSTFYYNPLAGNTQRVEQNYRRWFKEEMQYAQPRFALTGYDHAQYFLRGLHRYGKTFTGIREQNASAPLQTPLRFQRIGEGGMQNVHFQLIHYTRDHRVESLSY